ncbi:MAG: zinc ribbon domain-containing protein [Alphaproteobacteria bacterium]|nr:zinc ribbon domain-containing protein [Alphaproteobacteria bacterium]
MSARKRFRCLSCGKRFEAEVLSEDEVRAARLRGEPLGPIHCPECNRTNCRGGWE